MLVCTSNWLLADGSLSEPPSPRQTARWLRFVRAAATSGGCRRDGSYSPLERILLVFAGDSLDGLASVRWLGETKPWHDGGSARAAWESITNDAIRRCGRGVAAIRRLARHGLVVPAATGRGRAGGRHRVPVELVVLPGDRDDRLHAAAIWQEGSSAPLVRPSLEVPWETGRLLVRHGHEYDPAAWAGGEGPRVATLAGSIAVDLVGRLVRGLIDRPIAGIPARRLGRELAGCSVLDLPAVAKAWTNSTGPHGRSCRLAADRWREAIDHWHRGLRSSGLLPEGGHPGDAVADFLTRAGPGGARAAAPPPEPLVSLAAVTPKPLADHCRLVLGHLPAAGESETFVGLGRAGPPPAIERRLASGVDVAVVRSPAGCATPVRESPLPVAVIFEAGEYGRGGMLTDGLTPAAATACHHLDGPQVIDAARAA